jgi:SAM-dependent methyltransferase
MARNARILIDSQIAYYEARASEYERSLGYRAGRFRGTSPDAAALDLLARIVRALPRVRSTLEIGCGSGIWTRELLRICGRVHCVDSSPAMIARNRAACRRASHACADFFQWNSSQQFELVAAAFWLSHVPEPMFEPVIEKVRRLNAPRGRVLIVDEAALPEGGSLRSQRSRRLRDGRRFQIVKVYRKPADVREAFARAGYRPSLDIRAGRFFAIVMSAAR